MTNIWRLLRRQHNNIALIISSAITQELSIAENEPRSVSATDFTSFDYRAEIQRLGDTTLSPGQTDSQVVASSGKLNLGRDLRWMAKRTGKFPRKCTKVEKKSYFKATGSVTELALTWVGWPNGKKLALTCGQI